MCLPHFARPAPTLAMKDEETCARSIGQHSTLRGLARSLARPTVQGKPPQPMSEEEKVPQRRPHTSVTDAAFVQVPQDAQQRRKDDVAAIGLSQGVVVAAQEAGHHMQAAVRQAGRQAGRRGRRKGMPQCAQICAT
eukprot:362907-Chlamydomonas_euryale.AAC.9